VDTNLRINEFYTNLLKDPFYAPLARFRSPDGGMYLNTLQPRLGVTYDASGNGSRVIRAGWGRYVARNRPWFEDRAMNQTTSGPLSASNPRPVPQFAQVSVLQNYVNSSYNALQFQLRTRVQGASSLQVSSTLSKQRLEGVDFFSTFRGTQRTPQDVGDHPLDT